jgi:hypothetical protein
MISLGFLPVFLYQDGAALLIFLPLGIWLLLAKENLID